MASGQRLQCEASVSLCRRTHIGCAQRPQPNSGDPGAPLIDDDTLPDIVLARDKETGEIARDPDGKPYVSIRGLMSLLIGAIKQLGGEQSCGG